VYWFKRTTIRWRAKLNSNDTGRTNGFGVHVNDGIVVANEPNFVGDRLNFRHRFVGDAYLQNVS
jgi:hypothetical protein